jgi:prepilin-type N-terminal cleavage/methylation domain-containing protein
MGKMSAGRPRLPRGFTLVEVSVVLGIIVTLSALGVEALSALKPKSIFANTANDLLVRLREARMEAFSRGASVVVVLQKAEGRYWVIVDTDGNFDLTTFDPNAPAPSPDRLLGTYSLEAPVRVGPSDGWGGPLPAPWGGVPATTACGPCGGGALGAITFLADGSAVAGGARGTALTLEQPGLRRRTFVVSALTGSIESFER